MTDDMIIKTIPDPTGSWGIARLLFTEYNLKQYETNPNVQKIAAEIERLNGNSASRMYHGQVKVPTERRTRELLGLERYSEEPFPKSTETLKSSNDLFEIINETEIKLIGEVEDLYAIVNPLIREHYCANNASSADGLIADNNFRVKLVIKIRDMNPGKTDPLEPGRAIISSGITNLTIPTQEEFRHLLSELPTRSGTAFVSVPNERKKLFVAVTIDDGPFWNTEGTSPTEDFLVYLVDELKIQVTWFIQYFKIRGTEKRGFRWRGNPNWTWIKVYQYLQSLGHEIGIHSYYRGSAADHASWLPEGRKGSPVPVKFGSFDNSYNAFKDCWFDLKKEGFDINFGRPPGGWVTELAHYIEAKYGKTNAEALRLARANYNTEKFSFVNESNEPRQFLNRLAEGTDGFKIHTWPCNAMLRRQCWDKQYDGEKKEFALNTFSPTEITEQESYFVLLAHDKLGSINKFKEGMQIISEYARNNQLDLQYITLTELAKKLGVTGLTY